MTGAIVTVVGESATTSYTDCQSSLPHEMYILTIDINPFFALGIFICVFQKGFEYTTRGQFHFQWLNL